MRMIDVIADIVSQVTYAGIFFLMAVLPSELVMPFAGYLSSQGTLQLLIVIIVGTLGSTSGSLLLYWLARLVPQRTVSRWIVSYGRIFGITNRRVARAGAWFDDHARMAVFVGRFVPGLRSVVSIPAGNRKMPVTRFIIWTALGSGTWIAFLAFLGYQLGARYEFATSPQMSWLSAMVGLILFLIWLLYHRHQTCCHK